MGQIITTYGALMQLTSADNDWDLHSLLADIENDAIDKSHWRNRKDPLITPKRAAKGNLCIERDANDHIQAATVMNAQNRLIDGYGSS